MTMTTTMTARTRARRTGRAIAAGLAAAGALVVGLGAANAAGASTTGAEPHRIIVRHLCPAAEIAKVWYGGESDVAGCENMADRLDHLFYPGHMFTTALADRYEENVVFIQLRLRDLNYRPLVIDGYYGNQTAGAVTRYQRNHGLIVDGKVGQQTWKALFGLGPA